MEPPPIKFIKSKNNDKSDKYSVKIKLRRDHTSEKLDLYSFKIALFDNGETGEFLLLVRNLANDSQGISNVCCWRKDSVSSYTST